jgi:Spy/CpxP family protein refolding chaperone
MKAGIAVRLGLAIAGILLAGSALAQGPGEGPGAGPGFGDHQPPIERAFGGQGIHGRWWNNPKIVERLKLTDEQRKSFDEILFQHRETLIDLRSSLAKAELELEPLIRNDQPNEARIVAQIDKVAQARAELEKANARYLLAIRSKLTPEQWKKVQEFRANRGLERRGEGRGGWGSGGQGRGGQYQRQTPPALQPAPPETAPQGAGSNGPGTGAGTEQ